MYKKIILLILALLTLLCWYSVGVAADNNATSNVTDVLGKINEHSIDVSEVNKGDPIASSQSLAFRILGVAKVIVSGLALIWLVLIGVYMVAFSDNEERVKSQRKQIIYTLVGFLFLNIPGLVYQIFFTGNKSTEVVGGMPSGGWGNILGGFFWDDTILDGVIGDLIGFFQVFIFAIAVLMFTWGLFLLIVSGGDEEKMKSAKSRLIYGTLALIFMGFVRLWGTVVALGQFDGGIQSTANTFFSLALYFAGPIAIFFLMFGGYYYITSGGDEERTKKGKSIITNTFIATLILLAAYSFMTDLIHFTV